MNQQQPQLKIDLMDFFRVIFKRKRLILAVVLLTVLGAGVFSFLRPEIYRVQTSLEIGKVKEQPIEEPKQVMQKINAGVYNKPDYPNLKVENPQGTNLIKIRIESPVPQKDKEVLAQINTLILNEHQKKMEKQKSVFKQDFEKDLRSLEGQLRTQRNKIKVLRKEKKSLEDNIVIFRQNIKRTQNKIKFLEQGKENLKDKISLLNKVSFSEMNLGTRFVLLDTKQQLARKKQGIESFYSRINSLKTKINSHRVEIYSKNTEIDSLEYKVDSLEGQIKSLKQKRKERTSKATKVLTEPTVSKKPIRPNLKLNLILGAVLGVLLGVFLAFFVENTYLPAGKQYRY